MNNWSNNESLGHVLPGGHARARVLVHEPETPAALHQEEDEDVPGRTGLQGQGWQHTDPEGGACSFIYSGRLRMCSE